ncbi:MAG: hypothetical protein D6791_14810 [Chloroflexi bacterium]|nr:MAG: hypothetical protein D6791_14810 [Chloroflexota bacterium]
MPDYAAVWDQYDLAVEALYQALGPARAVTLPTVRTANVLTRADLVITTTARLADAAAQGLTAPDAAGRERATLQLMAGAAVDLAIANDLIRAQGDGRAPTIRKATEVAYRQVMSDLGHLLRPGAEPGPATTIRKATFKPTPENPQEALDQLRWTATNSFESITGDVVSVAQMAITGLTALKIAPVREAAAVAAQELLNGISGRVSTVLRRAARLLVQAYDKILKALGKDAASDARRQAAEWIQMLQSGTLLEKLLARLYEKERILDDIEGYARKVTDALMSEAYATVLQKTRNLAERFQHHRRSIEWILRGLAFIKDWLFSLQPWGPLAVTATYVGTLGYAVYAGGDYVDWFRTDRIQPLDRVPGLRDVVRETLKPGTETDNEEQPPESTPEQPNQTNKRNQGEPPGSP